jgi:hypothetical protein
MDEYVRAWTDCAISATTSRTVAEPRSPDRAVPSVWEEELASVRQRQNAGKKPTAFTTQQKLSQQMMLVHPIIHPFT